MTVTFKLLENASFFTYYSKSFKALIPNYEPTFSVKPSKSICSIKISFAVISESAVKQELRLGLLSKVELIDDIKLMRHVYYIKRKDEKLPLSTKLFLKFAKEVMISKSKGLESP